MYEVDGKLTTLHDNFEMFKHEIAKILDTARTQHGFDENTLRHLVWSSFMLSKRWPKELPIDGLFLLDDKEL